MMVILHLWWLKKGMRCCKIATKIINACPATPHKLFYLIASPVASAKKNPQQPGANRIYSWGSRTIALLALVLPTWTRCRERIVGVSYCCTASTLRRYAVRCTHKPLASVAHTCNLYYSLPVVRHADTDVCYLEHHTQAQLTHTTSISTDEVYHFSLSPVL